MWLNLNRLGIQALWTAMIVQFVAGLMTSSVSTVAPQIASSIHFDASFIGIYTFFVYTGACISSLIGGSFIHKYGPARIAEYALLAFAISLLVCVFGWSFIIIVSGLLLGLGKGCLMPALNTMVSHHTKKKRINLVFSIKQTSGPVGVALSGVILPYLAIQYDWRVALAFAGILGALGACWCAFVKKDQDTYKDIKAPINFKSLEESFKLVVVNKSLLQLAIISIFFKGLSVTALAYLVTFLVYEQFTLQFAGFALSISTAGTFIGRLFWGWLADKIESSKAVLALCGTLMGFMTICLAQVDSQSAKILVLLIAFFIGFCAKGWSGVYFAQVALNSPASKVPQATGGAHFFMYMGAIFVPMFFGLLVTYLDQDYRLTFYIISILTLATGFFLFFINGRTTTGNLE